LCTRAYVALQNGGPGSGGSLLVDDAGALYNLAETPLPPLLVVLLAGELPAASSGSGYKL
jgi:hypothetical protein